MPSKYLNYVLNILIRAFFSRVSRIGFVCALSQCTLGDSSVWFPVSVKSFVTHSANMPKREKRSLVSRAVSIKALRLEPITKMEEKRGHNRFSSSSPSSSWAMLSSFLFRTSVNIFSWSILAKTDQLWKKWGFLTKIMGLYSPGLWKNSHFGDYIKLIFLLYNKCCFSFRKSTNI